MRSDGVASVSDSSATTLAPQVLPLYVVVMMAHGTTEPVVAENLEAFLGEHAVGFTTWCAYYCT